MLGAVLANSVRDSIVAGMAKLGPDAAAAAQSGGGTGTLDSKGMPGPIAMIVRAAYGDATGQIFLISAIFAAVALLAVLFLKEVPLRTTVSTTEEVTAAVTTGTGAAEDPPVPSGRVTRATGLPGSRATDR